MKLVNRYHLWASLECQHFSKAEAVLKFSAEEDGMWVQYQDYAKLKAEVDALKLGSLMTAVDVLQFIKLKEENERLRKAGDNLARAADENGCHDNGDAKDLDDSIDRWYAAKEGKPSV